MKVQHHTSIHKAQHLARTLHHHLVRKGMKNDAAAAVGAAVFHAAKHAYDHPLDALEAGHTLSELSEASKKLKQAKHYLSNTMITRVESIEELTKRVSAARNVFHTAGVNILMEGLKKSPIPYNKCTLSFSKVTLDASEILGGSLAAETVVGGIFAAISAHAASEDSMEFVTECFGVPKEKQEETRDSAMSMRTVLYHP